jgi:Tfp pilus assembly protein PilX
MTDPKEILSGRKGIALLIVLCSIVIVAILANIILSVALNQARLTKHRISRVQAYYAAQMGMVYGIEKVKNGWTGAGEDRWYIYKKDACSSAPLPAQCTEEHWLPPSILNVTIVRKQDSSGPYVGPLYYNISANATYTYNYINP